MELNDQIAPLLKSLEECRKNTLVVSSKINKIHLKVAKSEKFTVRIGQKLQECYEEALACSAVERRIIEQVSDLLKSLEKRKKQKLDPKPVKFEPGASVVVKPNNDYILAILGPWLPEKAKYMVQDADDEGEKKYFFTQKQIIPLPLTPIATEFPTNHVVLALYPNTTCFYKATVILPPSLNTDEESPGMYCVRFDDDGGFDRFVHPQYCLEYPKKK